MDSFTLNESGLTQTLLINLPVNPYARTACEEAVLWYYFPALLPTAKCSYYVTWRLLLQNHLSFQLRVDYNYKKRITLDSITDLLKLSP